MAEFSMRLILKYFDKDGDGDLNREEEEKYQQVLELANSNRTEFFRKPEETRKIYDRFWCDSVIDENMKAQRKALEDSDGIDESGIEELVI